MPNKKFTYLFRGRPANVIDTPYVTNILVKADSLNSALVQFIKEITIKADDRVVFRTIADGSFETIIITYNDALSAVTYWQIFSDDLCFDTSIFNPSKSLVDEE